MVEAAGIHKRYKNKEVLQDISFQAEAGECVGIVGENGCGKTTLLSILAGTLKADGGSLTYFGQSALGSRKVIKEHVAYVPQENPLMEELSVRDNLLLWYQGDRARLSRDLKDGPAAILGLSGHEKETAGKLSGGMKKRLSIACALADHGRILIMDEPGAALDLLCKEVIRTYLDKYRSEGGIVVLTSHDLMEIKMCSRIYVMKGGTLKELEQGFPVERLSERL
ncbi:ATP-binding cassette domain-containing protein [Clostridium sp. AM58-1XD]|uniref:ABC transporter ATP-binding protein n=1 Tax=Clostridium sp. AM58-1XD TaxID=2292307 RepID=UPI000E478DB6|nr:ATP-binding cassette domain-containing protein [Clostridium sp. AM58-1XD]RGZ01859.1 ATP-binding cassette domain-containing protein [Clostridium sp. AM58-1XD]